MKYVKRDETGKIIGTFYNNQNGRYLERLYDDDPELLAFNDELSNKNIDTQNIDSNIQYIDNPQIFSYPGYTIFKIPYNVDMIKVKLWGAGGGSSASNSLGQSNNGYSGTYITCNINTFTIENKNLIIHVGGRGKKSFSNSFGYSDGAGGGGYSSISIFDGNLLVSAAGGNGGNGVSYNTNDNTISDKHGSIDNGGINSGKDGSLGEIGAGGKGGVGGGTTFADEILTSLVKIKNGTDNVAPNTNDPHYIPGVNISHGGITPAQKLVNGTDGGDGLVIIEW